MGPYTETAYHSQESCWCCGGSLWRLEPPVQGIWRCPACQQRTVLRAEAHAALRERPASAVGMVVAVPYPLRLQPAASSIDPHDRGAYIMASLNKVILMGHLTRNPDLRYTPSGTPVTTVGLAINRRYRQGDETKEDVCFVDAVVFGRQAETVCAYLQKGSPALVEGRLQWRSWETEDGQRRTKHEVVAERVQFLPNPVAVQKDGRDTAEASDDTPFDTDDVPF